MPGLRLGTIKNSRTLYSAKRGFISHQEIAKANSTKREKKQVYWWKTHPKEIGSLYHDKFIKKLHQPHIISKTKCGIKGLQNEHNHSYNKGKFTNSYKVWNIARNEDKATTIRIDNQLHQQLWQNGSFGRSCNIRRINSSQRNTVNLEWSSGQMQSRKEATRLGDWACWH